MSLKKFLITNWWTIKNSRKAQTTIEYFVLFTVLAAITIFGASSFITRVTAITNQAMNFSGRQMVQTDIDSYDGTVMVGSI